MTYARPARRQATSGSSRSHDAPAHGAYPPTDRPFAVTTASLPVEIPFIGRDRAERMLVLPKEEGDGIPEPPHEQKRPAQYD